MECNELQSTQYPLLCALLASGAVFWDRCEYVGIAVDGAEVSIGSDAMFAEKYLNSHPTPDTW